jgi:hypothetical protein
MPNSMMSHWKRNWDSAQAYLSLPVCRGFVTLGLGDGVHRCPKFGDNGLGAEVPRRLT